MGNNDSAYLQDILENIKILEDFLRGVSKESFFDNLEKQFAVARALEIIGEASGKLSEDFRIKHPEINWRAIKSMRNILIHEYAYVDTDEVWTACQLDIPDLKTKILKITNLV
jgi:uncharacterized protein with HEPN domain